MAQSGTVGVGPPWVGHVGASAPPPPRVMPRPAPPPRPTRGGGESSGGGRGGSNNHPGEASEAPKGCCGPRTYDCPPHQPPWDSPSSTASSAYFSFSSSNSSASPPPSAGSPPPHCNLPTPRVQEVRKKAIVGGGNPYATQNHQDVAEAKKPTPAPRGGAVKAETGTIPEDSRCEEGKKPSTEPPTSFSQDGCSNREEEDKGVDAKKSFRRPSDATETSVIRRRATVEVRSIAVQTPSGLMSNYFDSRATYPRTKGQSLHWRAHNHQGGGGGGGGPVAKSMDGEGGQSTLLAPFKKTSAPACEWHCSFVGGDESAAANTAVVGQSCDSPVPPRRGSAPSGDDRSRFDAEDVAASAADSPSEEDVEREAKEAVIAVREATSLVSRASVAHRRVSSRAELCPAPKVAYSDPPFSSENDPAQETVVQAMSSATKDQPKAGSQTSADDPKIQTPIEYPPSPGVQCQVSANGQIPSLTGGSPLTPPSPRKPATPPTPSRRQPSPLQSPKTPQKQTTKPSSPKCKPQQPSSLPPTRPQVAMSTPESSRVDPRHQSPLTHWLSELRSSKDAVEDEEDGVSMEEKGGGGRRLAEQEVELRGTPRGPCERALNRSRRGSGGEISIYEDACSCLNGEWCCGGDGGSQAATSAGDGKDCEPQSRETPRGGGYKGIWGIDGAALEEGEGVTLRAGGRARGEGIEWRLSALGLKDNCKAAVERNKEEGGERSVNVVPSAYNRRTVSEGMLSMGKGKVFRELEAKESEKPLRKESAEEPKTNGVPKKTSSNLSSAKERNKTPKSEGTNAGSPTAKSPTNMKPPPGNPDVVPAQTTKRSEGHVIRALPGDDEDWPRRSKFTEDDDVTCDDGDGLIILPGTPEGHRSRVSQSDSFRSTTSSESKLSSASASSSSQEIPTAGGYYNNNNSSTGNNSAKSSSCDNVSLSSSSGEVSSLQQQQQRTPNIPPRAKPPRKNIKPKNSGDVSTKASSLADRESETEDREGGGPSENKTAPETLGKATAATREESTRTPGSPKSSPVVVKKSPSRASIASGEEVKAVVSFAAAAECVEPPPAGGGVDKLPPRERDKSSRVECERDGSASGKPTSSSEGAPWEAGRGRKVPCPVVPPSPRVPRPAKPGRDKTSVASSSSAGDGRAGGARLSDRSAEDPSDAEGGGCGSELGLESPKCGDEEEEEEGFDGCEWKGVFVSGRRKGSYSSDIEAWKRGLSGWCSVEDEDEFLESTMFDPEDSSLSVGCGSPERSAEEWYSSNDMEGRLYYYEENSNESSWTLPEVSVVSPPQTPPPAGVSGSPAGSDSFISGRSSGGEEGTHTAREVMERDGSSHSIGGGNSLVGVSRDDMVAMPMVKMKMNQWEKGGRLIQLRDNTLDKDLRGGRSTRAAKTRSMVIGDPGLGEIKIPIPGKVPLAKDWPQLWDGNMYVLREGTLNKTKITENKKRVRKNWAPSHVVLTELFLLFFKDAKTFAALKAGTMGGSISPGDAGAMPELCVDLNGALVDREDQLSSRRNVFRVSTVLGLQVLCQDDNAQNAEAWFQDISKATLKLPSGFDGSPQTNTLEMRNYPEPQSPDEHKKFPRIGRSKSVKVKKDASMEDLSAANVTERQVKIKARLKKFFHRRPTMESLVKKGIWKDEPAFGCYLEQVSGEGIPRIPLFVQRCIAAIESKPENMKADGLYRASGNLSQVQKIRLQVDQNNLSVVDMEEDVHVLTGALKLFFRELKEPLIPYSLFNRALTASTNSNRKEQLHEFKEIVKILPVANYDTLKFLLQHLLRVTSYQEFNRMHIANLAIVFGPTLMWPKQESLNMALDLMQQNLVIECLLQEYDIIFSSGR